MNYPLSQESRSAAVAMARTAALITGGDRQLAINWLRGQSQTAAVIGAMAMIGAPQ